MPEQETDRPKKKKSLFARQFAKKSPKDFGVRAATFQPTTQSTVLKSTAPVSGNGQAVNDFLCTIFSIIKTVWRTDLFCCEWL